MMNKFFDLLERFFNHPRLMPPTPTNKPVEPPQPQPEPKRDLLQELCEAISVYEGGSNDLNHRNENPGNCRYFPIGYASIYGVVKKDPNGFAIFKDWPTGMLYLKNMIRIRAEHNPQQTLQQFMNVYAPSSENDPTKYATFLAKRLAVNKDTFLMGQLLS